MKAKLYVTTLLIQLIMPGLCAGSDVDHVASLHQKKITTRVINRTIHPKLCAAVRGNGGRIYAHFGALARTHELYGPLGAISGGSSGSLVSYLSDAIYTNPLTNKCGYSKCSRQEYSARLALLYKTLPTVMTALIEVYGGNPSWVPAVLSKSFDSNGIDTLLLDDPDAAVELFRTTVSDPTLKKFINPNILQTLDDAKDKASIISDLLSGIRGSSDFRLDSPLVFIRPGAMSANSVADLYGLIGGFYAIDRQGADRMNMSLFLNKCGMPGKGKVWEEIAGLPAGQRTCGSLLSNLLKKYSSSQSKASDSLFVDSSVSQSLPALVSVSYIGGSTANMLKVARTDYLSGKHLDWTPDFSDWRVLYSGRKHDLDLLAKNSFGYSDLKSQRTVTLTGLTWREIITRSISEPGIQSAVDLSNTGFTVGGWVDGQPVRALRNIGCETIIAYESLPTQVYPSTIAGLLGASSQEVFSLFSDTSPSSSHSINIAEADGVWCTDWSKGGTPVELSDMGWNAQLESRSVRLNHTNYPGLVQKRDSTLCTPPR